VARQWYSKLQQLTAKADTIRPEMMEARAFLEANPAAEQDGSAAAPQ
jgi:hypothetical protein